MNLSLIPEPPSRPRRMNDLFSLYCVETGCHWRRRSDGKYGLAVCRKMVPALFTDRQLQRVQRDILSIFPHRHLQVFILVTP